MLFRCFTLFVLTSSKPSRAETSETRRAGRLPDVAQRQPSIATNPDR